MAKRSRPSEAVSGATVALSEGRTYYELAGPEDGRLVVLVHGFSVPSFIWDPTFAALAGAGFRVLRYDLFGRGESDRPWGRYDLDRFERQLVELASAIGVGDSVDVVGLSMGGAIAVGVTARRPELVRKLALIDPAGMPMALSSRLRRLQFPLLGEVLMAVTGRARLMDGLRDDFHSPQTMTEIVARYREPYLSQLRRPGFLRALLSTLRNGVLTSMEPAYLRVGEQARQVLLIWGREDRTVPFALSERVLSALPNATLHAVDNAGHVPHLEHPALVNRLLIEFLRGPDMGC
jgi:pimeloyl-ACP methyl ester carboxylesterase